MEVRLPYYLPPPRGWDSDFFPPPCDRLRTVRILAMVLLLLALALLSSSVPRADAASQLFAPDSFWNRPLGPNAPLDPSSPQVMRHFSTLVAAERRDGGPAI